MRTLALAYWSIKCEKQKNMQVYLSVNLNIHKQNEERMRTTTLKIRQLKSHILKKGLVTTYGNSRMDQYFCFRPRFSHIAASGRSVYLHTAPVLLFYTSAHRRPRTVSAD